MDLDDIKKIVDKEKDKKQDPKLTRLGNISSPLLIQCILLMNTLKDDEEKEMFIFSLYMTLILDKGKNIDEVIDINKRFQKFFYDVVKSMDKKINE